jgi:hypothetical protein
MESMSLFDPYRGHEMVQQHHKLSHAFKQHQNVAHTGINFFQFVSLSLLVLNLGAEF